VYERTSKQLILRPLLKHESDERVKELKEKIDARCPVLNTLKAADVTINTTWRKDYSAYLA
jgi:uncharacterized OsmC-like protein